MHVHALGLCFTDATGLTFHHDRGLVVLSYLVAAVGSYTALEMIERWRNAAGAQAHYWQLASAAAFGGSIWAMHFIAMLALRISLPVTYAPGLTLLSLVIAIGVVGLGLQIVRANASWGRICCAGVTVGLGAAAMHYVGMAAIRFPGSLAYTPSLWSLSVLLGIVAATAALWLSLTVRARWQRTLAALVMAVAICGMHYTAMASTVFQVDPLAPVASGLSSGPLAAVVALATLALTLCALGFVAADRRLVASEMRDAEVLRQANAYLASANASLELGHQQFDAVLANIVQGVCLFDGSQRLLAWNRRFTEIYGLPPETASVGVTLKEIVETRHAAGSGPDMSPSDYVDWCCQTASGGQPSGKVVALQNGQVVAINLTPMPGGGWVATHEDITERQQAEAGRKQAEASVLFMARHDALTGLANRVLFNERLDQAIEMAVQGIGCALLCLDLDHFKLINDTRGHQVGDGLLQATAGRLQACVREMDTVARLGGDEFAIVQLDVAGAYDADLLAQRILTAFRAPFDIDGHQIMVGTSVGVAIPPGDGATAEKLFNNADIALYLAKSEGRGTVRFFEPEMDARIHARRSLELDLDGAIARNEFEIYYQPLVNLATGRVSEFEALLRWHHPARGLISPADFIPLAEETGRIVEIGEWVLRTACFEAENWPADIKVAVNLSAIQFTAGNPVDAVKAALAASGLRPDRLEVEITETTLLRDTVGTLAALHHLRSMGIAVALDDFGTGYSSLGYLRSFPFDKIKIDQSFVRDLAHNAKAMSIVRAVTGLGRSLNMTTTAEGVETLEQLERLWDEGCTEVQGYFFSHPKPASEVPSLIETIRQVRPQKDSIWSATRSKGSDRA
jgi:diguanylate cyclase (GGDEF)-like protein